MTLLLAEGRLVNLGCATGHPSFVMSNSFKPNLAQIELWKNRCFLQQRSIHVTKTFRWKVAILTLAKLGVELELLRDDQAAYLVLK
jgi:adenosylhomocysteinase